jgi:hypothetical protein
MFLYLHKCGYSKTLEILKFSDYDSELHYSDYCNWSIEDLPNLPDTISIYNNLLINKTQTFNLSFNTHKLCGLKTYETIICHNRFVDGTGIITFESPMLSFDWFVLSPNFQYNKMTMIDVVDINLEQLELSRMTLTDYVI